jgi:hypothetical protein
MIALPRRVRERGQLGWSDSWLEGVPPPLFLHLRILKDLQTRFLELRILKDLRADNFGQDQAKRGICPELRILKDLSGAVGSEQWIVSSEEIGRGGVHPPATMQKSENKGVAGGATCKLLKTKVQLCRESCTDER